MRASQRARGEDGPSSTASLAAEELRRTVVAAFDTLRAEQKELGKQVAKAQGDEKAALLARAKELADASRRPRPTREAAASESRPAACCRSRNIVEDGVPASAARTTSSCSRGRHARATSPPRASSRATTSSSASCSAPSTSSAARRSSGSRFYYLTGVGALLELALLQPGDGAGGRGRLHPDDHRRRWSSPRAMEGTGFLGSAAENVYRLEADDLYLVGTSRGAARGATTWTRSSTLSALPMRYAGFSTCFRREAGHATARTPAASSACTSSTRSRCSRSVDPRTRDAEHQRLLAWEKELLDALELPYRVIDVASRRPRRVGRAQVRLRGVDPDPGQVPRGDVDVELHRVPGPPARHPDARDADGGGKPRHRSRR